jgi:hypothetical protein
MSSLVKILLWFVSIAEMIGIIFTIAWWGEPIPETHYGFRILIGNTLWFAIAVMLLRILKYPSDSSK